MRRKSTRKRLPGRPSRRALEKSLALMKEAHTSMSAEMVELRTRLERAERAAKAHVDVTMIQERIRLASALGQMIEATSKAVMFIIAKEAV